MQYFLQSITFLLLLLGCNCSQNPSKPTKKPYPITLKMATDAEYPNNNMIGFRSRFHGQFSHVMAAIIENENGSYDFEVFPNNAQSDTLTLRNINLLEFMPSIPQHIRKDGYLSFLSILNQEWNRIQVKFNDKLFQAHGTGNEKNVVNRLDVANNCLKKGLWEVLAFSQDSLCYQSWFDFPDTLYNQLFFKRNGVPIGQYDNMLKNYSFEKGKYVNLDVLRQVRKEENLSFQNLNNGYYPIKGERASKFKNIIFPAAPQTINDFLTDSTRYATFAPPGQYTRADPRKTQLGRLQHLEKLTLAQTVSNNAQATATQELQFFYTDKDKTRTTRYVIGGLELNKLPVLSPDMLHIGWQRPMGIANHSFYSSYQDFISNSSLENAYFSFLLDAKGDWIDSHDVGIDGILLYREVQNANKVHAYILSFERHSFVGHTVFEVKMNSDVSPTHL